MPVCHFVLRQKSASNVTGNSAVWTQSRQRGLRKVVWSASGRCGGSEGGEEKCMKNVSPTLFDYALSLGRVPQTSVLTGVPSLFKQEHFVFSFWKDLLSFSQWLFSALPVPANRNCLSDQCVLCLSVSLGRWRFWVGVFEKPWRASVWGLPTSVSSKCFKKKGESFFFCYFWGTVQRLLNLVV